MSLKSFAAAMAMLGATATMSVAASGNRSVVNLPDGRLLALVGASSQSMSSVNGDMHIVADGVAIEFVDGKMTVDGAAREVPEFTRMLEVKLDGGAVTLTADP
jgi:hypothetical protein